MTDPSGAGTRCTAAPARPITAMRRSASPPGATTAATTAASTSAATPDAAKPARSRGFLPGRSAPAVQPAAASSPAIHSVRRGQAVSAPRPSPVRPVADLIAASADRVSGQTAQAQGGAQGEHGGGRVAGGKAADAQVVQLRRPAGAPPGERGPGGAAAIVQVDRRERLRPPGRRRPRQRDGLRPDQRGLTARQAQVRQRRDTTAASVPLPSLRSR